MAIVDHTMKKMKISSTCNNRRFLLDDLWLEIFARLPMKSMWLCKCVCKRWNSIISDPQYMRSYRNIGETRNVLLSIRDGGTQRYLCAGLGKGQNASASEFKELFSVPYSEYDGVTQVINGLVCFYQAHRVYLCNLSTGEIMNLPSSPYATGGEANEFRYFFGFDPTSSLYKVLRLHIVKLEFHILTLRVDMAEEEGSWRLLSGENHFDFVPDQSVCVAGTLYWMGKGDIIAFDLNCHEFRSILHPSGPRIKELYQNSSYFYSAAVQFRGCMAFAYKRGSHCNIAYLISHKLGDLWYTHTFDIPTELIQLWNNLTPFGTLPTGEIMLVEPEASHCFTPIYSYDPDTQKFERFVVAKFPPSETETETDFIRLSFFDADVSPLRVILKKISKRPSVSYNSFLSIKRP